MMNQDPPAPCYLCDGLSTDTHHIVGGRGKRWVDTWNEIRVCRPCHRLIESDYNLRKRLRKERQDKIEWWLLQCPPKGKRIVYDRPEWVKEDVWYKLVRLIQFDSWENGYRIDDLIRRMMGKKY